MRFSELQSSLKSARGVTPNLQASGASYQRDDEKQRMFTCVSQRALLFSPSFSSCHPGRGCGEIYACGFIIPSRAAMVYTPGRVFTRDGFLRPVVGKHEGKSDGLACRLQRKQRRGADRDLGAFTCKMDSLHLWSCRLWLSQRGRATWDHVIWLCSHMTAWPSIGPFWPLNLPFNIFNDPLYLLHHATRDQSLCPPVRPLCGAFERWTEWPLLWRADWPVWFKYLWLRMQSAFQIAVKRLSFFVMDPEWIMRICHKELKPHESSAGPLRLSRLLVADGKWATHLDSVGHSSWWTTWWNSSHIVRL